MVMCVNEFMKTCLRACLCQLMFMIACFDRYMFLAVYVDLHMYVYGCLC